MKKLLILISIIMLLFSVTVTLGEVMQEDLKALESLVDIMSSKVAENGETMGNMEGDIEALGEGIEAMEKNLQGLNAADRFLWAKIEAQSPEALIEGRINALKEQMEAYVAQLESEIVELAEKIEDQTLLNKLENRITALKGNLEMFIAKEEEQQTLIAS
ncbi:MAG TPA: hypothetical protein P5107_13400, partial [Thermotogota bacterium]|nr:hypothetical protein [Thermotogota bacterium]